ncbi:hypothetical protein ALC60_06126 [Trachymyrmex zeteki]|uniref:Uncharacterized protein n=1 Tax=Mycetomoellerius zeteki TaxID=64791 RepID=A0A151X454_9HYME|nr:hypothetical protein ALC60_06126 [Trachymyrmex zeteki]
MGGGHTHWLKKWIHHFCDFTGVADPIQSELRWPSGLLAVRQRFGDRFYFIRRWRTIIRPSVYFWSFFK